MLINTNIIKKLIETSTQCEPLNHKKMTKKKELEKLIKENGYNEDLQDTYMREVLDEDREFDEDFDIDWEV